MPYTSAEMRRFNHLMGELDAVYHCMSLKLGVTDSEMSILYTVCDVGEPCPIREICRRCGLSKQTVNSALRKLEEQKSIRLETCGFKSKSIVLTDSGRKLAEETALRVIGIENEIFEAWPKEDMERYLGYMEKYLSELSLRAERLNCCLDIIPSGEEEK